MKRFRRRWARLLIRSSARWHYLVEPGERGYPRDPISRNELVPLCHAANGYLSLDADECEFSFRRPNVSVCRECARRLARLDATA